MNTTLRKGDVCMDKRGNILVANDVGDVYTGFEYFQDVSYGMNIGETLLVINKNRDVVRIGRL
jgi:hypothetical protein